MSEFKNAIGLLILITAILSSGCIDKKNKPEVASAAGEKPVPQPAPRPTPVPVDDEKEFVCSTLKVESSVNECVFPSGSNPSQRIAKTISSWGDEAGKFAEYGLERKSFHKRYNLSLEEIECLKQKLCMEQTYENSN